VSQRDKLGNTAQAAMGKTKRAVGKAAGNPYAQVEGGAEKKKANVKQAGEKLKDTAKKIEAAGDNRHAAGPSRHGECRHPGLKSSATLGDARAAINRPGPRRSNTRPARSTASEANCSGWGQRAPRRRPHTLEAASCHHGQHGGRQVGRMADKVKSGAVEGASRVTGDVRAERISRGIHFSWHCKTGSIKRCQCSTPAGIAARRPALQHAGRQCSTPTQ